MKTIVWFLPQIPAEFYINLILLRSVTAEGHAVSALTTLGVKHDAPKRTLSVDYKRLAGVQRHI